MIYDVHSCTSECLQFMIHLTQLSTLYHSSAHTVWYVKEIMAQENTDKDSGFVFLAYMKDFTIWDYDYGLAD